MTSTASLPAFVTADDVIRWERAGGVEVGGTLRPLVLVHVRWPAMREPEGQTPAWPPGAIVASLDDDLSDPPAPVLGRHPMPSPEDFARRLGLLGIPDDAVVVAWDSGVGAIAARLVWMRRVVGRPAAVLDGGMTAWREAGGPLADSPSTREPVVATPAPWPEDRLADADVVDALRTRPDAVVIDVRDAERFRGDHEPIDARAGHVPGAVNRPFTDAVDGAGQLLPPAALQQLHAGAADAAQIVVSCGSGVTACHTLLVLEDLGVTARLSSGSWSGWSSDPDRPVATGD